MQKPQGYMYLRSTYTPAILQMFSAPVCDISVCFVCAIGVVHLWGQQTLPIIVEPKTHFLGSFSILGII